MINYKPSLPCENNVTSFKCNIRNNKLFRLLLGTICCLSIFFLAIYLFCDAYVLSHKDQIDAFFNKHVHSLTPCSSENDQKMTRFQAVLDKLVASYEDKKSNITLCHTDRILGPNAFASLGRKIIITDDLLRTAQKDEEIAFILGHELGHIYNEDIYKGVSRSVVNSVFGLTVGIITQFSFEYGDLFFKIIELKENIYSRQIEYAADAFALKLFMKNYQDYGTAFNFLESTLKHDDFGIHEIFYNHPDSSKRLERLRHMAKSK